MVIKDGLRIRILKSGQLLRRVSSKGGPHLDAGRVVEDDDLYAVAAEIVLAAVHVYVVEDDDSGDLEPQGSASAHGTGRQSGIEGGALPA